MNGFEAVKLKKPNLLQRMFGLRVKGNAYLEIQNELAKAAIGEIDPNFVEGRLAKYHISGREALPRLAHIYGTVLGHFAQDLELTDIEVEDLRRLRDLLGLKDLDIASVERSVLDPIYRGQLKSAVADALITPEEKTRLNQLVTKLRLPSSVVEAIRKEEIQPLFQRAFDRAIEDRRLAPDEETQLAQIAQDLGTKITYDEPTTKLLDRYRLLWRIENGELPDLPVEIRLQRGERAHFAAPASHHEFRTVTTSIGYAGPTARIRIAKGVYWRMGKLGLQRSTKEVLKQLDTGTLYVTGKRLILDGAAKTTNIPLRRVMNFTPYADGIRIEKDSGKDQFFMCAEEHVEMLACVLGAVLMADQG